MKEFNYNPNISGLDIIKNENEQHSEFFQDGHPYFLIPDFDKDPADVWTTFLDYLENEYLDGESMADQEGGEVSDVEIIDKNTGFTKCKYTAYDIMMNDESDPVDIEVDIEGYVVKGKYYTYFLTTKVVEHYDSE